MDDVAYKANLLFMLELVQSNGLPIFNVRFAILTSILPGGLLNTPSYAFNPAGSFKVVLKKLESVNSIMEARNSG